MADIEQPMVTINPMDLPSEVFAAGLDRRASNRTALMKWVAKSMVEGVDYGSIPTKRGPSKSSLWKPGAEKICGMLGCHVRFPNLQDYEQAALSGTDLKQIIIRAEIVDPNGNVVAHGIGARSLKQDFNDMNKSLKMAEKSAHIDATLRMAGLSEVFTQDLEDMPPEAASDDQVARYWELIQTAQHLEFYTFIHSLNADQRIDVVNKHPATMKKTQAKQVARDFESATEKNLWKFVGDIDACAVNTDESGLTEIKDQLNPAIWLVIGARLQNETAHWLKSLPKPKPKQEK